MQTILKHFLIFIMCAAGIIAGGLLYEYGFAWLGIILETAGGFGASISVIIIIFKILNSLDDDEKSIFNS